MGFSQDHGGGGNVRLPERPRQQQHGSERSPGQHHRRRSQPSEGEATVGVVAPTSGLSAMATPSRHQTPGRHSSASESRSGGSRSSSLGGPRSSSHYASHEEGGVRVVVRVRPLSDEEEANGGERTMRCCNPKSLEFMNTPIDVVAAGASGGLRSSSEGGGGEGEGESRQYAFDLCAHEGFSQEEMFQSCGLMPLLSAAINGYAGTVFAYGATGAGKTYTMSGREQVLGPGRGPRGRIRGGVRKRPPGSIGDGTEGLVPRSMRFLFQQISALPSEVTMRVRASFYEIYNEVVYDLLTQRDRRPLQVRYDVRRGFFVQGLFEVEIRGLHDIMAVVDEGNGNRKVSSHLLNKDSSRSHSLLTVYLDSEKRDPEDGHLVKQFGKVSFVDLAGSERLKRSKALDEKETGAINKSLMTLGKVISALSKRSAVAAAAAANASLLVEASVIGTIDSMSTPAVDSTNNSTTQSRGSTQKSNNYNGNGAVAAAVVLDQTGGAAPGSDIWVPYRDSTLTKLLMDSLGGNGLTLMVACVSPSVRHAEESAATLNYAARARNIRNRPLVRIDARERLINALRREINLLREENELLRRNKLQHQHQQHQQHQHGNVEESEQHQWQPLQQSLMGTYAGRTVEDLGGSSPAGINDNGDSILAPKLGLPHAGGGMVAPSGGGGGGAAVVPEDRSLLQQSLQKPPSVVQIGQASRDVAVLLRKYEEECHRLRNEAAQAHYKEQEIGKQTRLALVENDALSRTVERLQRSFSIDKTRPGVDHRYDARRGVKAQQSRSGGQSQSGGATQQHHYREPPTVSLKEDERERGSAGEVVGDVEGAGVMAMGDLEQELMHLRIVNESLAERVEFFERGQLKATTGRGGVGGVAGAGNDRRMQKRSGPGGIVRGDSTGNSSARIARSAAPPISSAAAPTSSATSKAAVPESRASAAASKGARRNPDTAGGKLKPSNSSGNSVGGCTLPKEAVKGAAGVATPGTDTATATATATAKLAANTANSPQRAERGSSGSKPRPVRKHGVRRDANGRIILRGNKGYDLELAVAAAVATPPPGRPSRGGSGSARLRGRGGRPPAAAGGRGRDGLGPGRGRGAGQFRRCTVQPDLPKDGGEPRGSTLGETAASRGDAAEGVHVGNAIGADGGHLERMPSVGSPTSDEVRGSCDNGRAMEKKSISDGDGSCDGLGNDRPPLDPVPTSTVEAIDAAAATGTVTTTATVEQTSGDGSAAEEEKAYSTPAADGISNSQVEEESSNASDGGGSRSGRADMEKNRHISEAPVGSSSTTTREAEGSDEINKLRQGKAGVQVEGKEEKAGEAHEKQQQQQHQQEEEEEEGQGEVVVVEVLEKEDEGDGEDEVEVVEVLEKEGVEVKGNAKEKQQQREGEEEDEEAEGEEEDDEEEEVKEEVVVEVKEEAKEKREEEEGEEEEGEHSVLAENQGEEKIAPATDPDGNSYQPEGTVGKETGDSYSQSDQKRAEGTTGENEGFSPAESEAVNSETLPNGGDWGGEGGESSTVDDKRQSGEPLGEGKDINSASSGLQDEGINVQDEGINEGGKGERAPPVSSERPSDTSKRRRTADEQIPIDDGGSSTHDASDGAFDEQAASEIVAVAAATLEAAPSDTSTRRRPTEDQLPAGEQLPLGGRASSANIASDGRFAGQPAVGTEAKVTTTVTPTRREKTRKDDNLMSSGTYTTTTASNAPSLTRGALQHQEKEERGATGTKKTAQPASGGGDERKGAGAGASDSKDGGAGPSSITTDPNDVVRREEIAITTSSDETSSQGPAESTLAVGGSQSSIVSGAVSDGNKKKRGRFFGGMKKQK